MEVNNSMTGKKTAYTVIETRCASRCARLTASNSAAARASRPKSWTTRIPPRCSWRNALIRAMRTRMSR